jgi:hypothetical protein
MGELWAFTDHLCARCLGRVLSRRGEGGAIVVRCSNCGTQADRTPEAICCCGIRRGDAAFRCVRLERLISGILGEIVVTGVG